MKIIFLSSRSAPEQDIIRETLGTSLMSDVTDYRPLADSEHDHKYKSALLILLT